MSVKWLLSILGAFVITLMGASFPNSTASPSSYNSNEAAGSSSSNGPSQVPTNAYTNSQNVNSSSDSSADNYTAQSLDTSTTVAPDQTPTQPVKQIVPPNLPVNPPHKIQCYIADTLGGPNPPCEPLVQPNTPLPQN